MVVLEENGNLQMAALLRYHYGLEVDRMPEAKRLRLFAELEWIKKAERNADNK